MTSSSLSFRLLWVALMVFPSAVLVHAIGQGRAQSADEALDGLAPMVTMLVAVVVVAVVVFIASLASARMHGAEKVVVTSVALSVVPMYFLVSATWWYIGWPERGRSVTATVLVVGGNALWVAVALWVGARLTALRRGAEPAKDEGKRA
jgi:hypothetical protein